MTLTDAHPELDEGWRVPSERSRCSSTRCTAPAVADHRSDRWQAGRWVPVVFGLCAEHLRRRGREIRDGVVWWDPEVLHRDFARDFAREDTG